MLQSCNPVILSIKVQTSIFATMNTFGTIFRINIFGESHGKWVGVTIDGCPAGIDLREADLFEEWLVTNSNILMYTGWERTDHDGFVVFSREEDGIYICGDGIDPTKYVEMEITIYGD